MRKIFLFISACLFLTFVSCSKEGKTDAAANAAKEYYDSLLVGNAAYFVRGMYLPDTIPDDYREQLEANARMFVARLNSEHHGIRDIRVLNCVNDTVSLAGKRGRIHIANAFLALCFGDSLNEEVVVQMIEHKGQWLMR